MKSNQGRLHTVGKSGHDRVIFGVTSPINAPFPITCEVVCYELLPRTRFLQCKTSLNQINGVRNIAVKLNRVLVTVKPKFRVDVSVARP
jgi:hypothetical protein